MFFRSLRRTFLVAVWRLLGGICSLLLPKSWRRSVPPRRDGLLNLFHPHRDGRAYPGPGRADERGSLLADLLLAGHGPLLALAAAGVGLRALAMHREPATVPDALVGANLDLAADVGLHLTAQVALDPVAGVDPVTEADELVVAQLVHPAVAAD